MKKYSVVIPVLNEEQFINLTIYSIINQSIKPYEIIVVLDENSNDNTEENVIKICKEYSFIKLIRNKEYIGKKENRIAKNFILGVQYLNSNTDIIAKIDADIILPNNYFEKVIKLFNIKKNISIVGGVAYIVKKNRWIKENLNNKNHIRGAFKCYNKKFYNQINGIKPFTGWDTLDELLSQFYNWETIVDESLIVKHLKPTGKKYTNQDITNQGLSYNLLGYNFILSIISCIKMSIKHKNIIYIFLIMKGYITSIIEKDKLIVSDEEKRFILNYRLNNIITKIFKI